LGYTQDSVSRGGLGGATTKLPATMAAARAKENTNFPFIDFKIVLIYFFLRVIFYALIKLFLKLKTPKKDILFYGLLLIN